MRFLASRHLPTFAGGLFRRNHPAGMGTAIPPGKVFLVGVRAHDLILCVCYALIAWVRHAFLPHVPCSLLPSAPHIAHVSLASPLGLSPLPSRASHGMFDQKLANVPTRRRRDGHLFLRIDDKNGRIRPLPLRGPDLLLIETRKEPSRVSILRHVHVQTGSDRAGWHPPSSVHGLMHSSPVAPTSRTRSRCALRHSVRTTAKSDTPKLQVSILQLCSIRDGESTVYLPRKEAKTIYEPKFAKFDAAEISAFTAHPRFGCRFLWEISGRSENNNVNCA